MKKSISVIVALALAAVAAPAVMALTPKETIETRQKSLKDLGASFKTVNDQSKAGSPDMAAIKAAAAKVEAHSKELGTWFPSGTGKDTGVKTEALNTIWEKPDQFKAAVARFQAEAPKLNAAAQSGDVAQVKAAFGGVGGACKNCHDNFREKK
jgi:cytochrome c556